MACDAAQRTVERGLGRHSVALARQATATGAKIAGACVDLGTGTHAAIGVANGLAGPGLRLYAPGIDIKDMRAGNRRLERPDTSDHTIFSGCPILGCHLIACADTSSAANPFIGDIGLPGWMDRVEKMKKLQVDPLLSVAGKAIDKSLLQLDRLQSNKGSFVTKGLVRQRHGRGGAAGDVLRRGAFERRLGPQAPRLRLGTPAAQPPIGVAAPASSPPSTWTSLPVR